MSINVIQISTAVISRLVFVGKGSTLLSVARKRTTIDMQDNIKRAKDMLPAIILNVLSQFQALALQLSPQTK